MNRTPFSSSASPSLFIEALEPRIAPAGLLNESKFTTVTLGTPILLDASGGPNDFQGLSTGFGSGAGTYLLYITTGKALVFTSDLNGDGKFEPGEITGISLGVDSQGRPANLILFSNVNGDIATNLLPGHGVSALTDSDNNPNNGRDGRVILPTDIGSITLRTVTSADLDASQPSDTVSSRLALTSFSIFGNIYCGGNFGGLSIDTSGDAALTAKFNGGTGDERYVSAIPQIGSIYTGSAVSGQSFHFTQNSVNNIDGQFQTFNEAPGQHGGDISNISAVGTGTIYSIGTLDTGDGGAGARGGDISNVTLHGVTGSYALIAGDGGAGAVGGQGGSIVNFNDLGTITGQVVLHTGAGGTGTLDTGGAGGTATFATTEIAANVEVFLGNGGDGFSSGGNGSGLPAATFITPEDRLAVGANFLGTWHDLGDVGNNHPLADGTYAPEVINFNASSYFPDPTAAVAAGQADNYGDGVFTTNIPGQVVVVFGDGAGFINDNGGDFTVNGQETVVLRIPGLINPQVTVGDFNGDGRPDIAVASNSVNNFAGVYVFLDQIGTALDPINSHNFSKNPLGDHPFSEALQSAIPSLPDIFGAFNGPGGVLALTTGDYNGDGIADIGVVRSETPLINTPFNAGVGILFGEAAHAADGHAFTNATFNPFTGTTVQRNAGTGYFYADSAVPGTSTLLQFTTVTVGGDVIARSSSLTSDNTIGTGASQTLAAGEVFLYASLGAKNGVLATVSGLDLTTHQPTEFIISLAGVGAGAVDTNRLLNTPKSDNTVHPLVLVTIQDFSFADLNNDGNVDLTFLTQSPVEYITTSRGDGHGGFTPSAFNTGPGGPTDDNAGIYLGQYAATAIANADFNLDGRFDEFGVLITDPDNDVLIREITLGSPGNAFYPGGLGTPGVNATFAIRGAPFDITVHGLDAFFEEAATADALHPRTGFGLISPNTGVLFDDVVYFVDPAGLVYLRSLTENSFYVVAGNGGNAIAGIGGSGGAIGAPTLTAGTDGDVTGPVGVTFPQSDDYQGQAFFRGGDGGSGFGGGGNGGSVEGVTVRYATGATLLTSSADARGGDGGASLAGAGGNGGNIDHVSLATGTTFAAGNGGDGKAGGMGGNLVGNGIATSFDASNSVVNLSAGIGGSGSATGGLGGSITNWDSVFLDVLGTGDSLSYISGAGGSAAAGPGGNGGSITNSSPNVNQDNLSGDLTLVAGAGGNGLTGGDGGAITTFINQPTNEQAVATVLTVLAGSGGIGVSSNGGLGGSITSFASSATGFDIAGDGIGRVIAGDGGASFGAQGGNGGSVTNTTAQTQSTPIVVAAGAGGAGLTIGGEGGAVTNSQINSAAQEFGKVLIVAGVGGDASSVLPSGLSIPHDTNTGDLAHSILAFGNAAPHGGDGGNITNITQPSSAQAAVDLIAGNGGSTLNSGTIIDQNTGVGQGGSITDINLTGTVGALSRNGALDPIPANPPIQAYTIVGETDDNGNPITDISTIIDQLAATQIFDGLAFQVYDITGVTDNTSEVAAGLAISGNVGIVAGEAGRVHGGFGTITPGLPPIDGINGSVQNITAESIMSVVAGSVSKIAPVNILSGITVTDLDGVLGVDRTPLSDTNDNPAGNGILDYLNQNGQLVHTAVQPGYSLVNGDGALYAITIEQTVGTILRGPRVFSVSAST